MLIHVGAPQVDVLWKLDAPFSISPLFASLAPGEVVAFTASFTPPEACSYTASAACQLESGAAAICKVGAWGQGAPTCYAGSRTRPGACLAG